MQLTNDKDLKGKHVEATVHLWLWHVEGMIKLSRMLVNVLYFMSGLEVLNYKLPTIQNSRLAASSIKVLTCAPANISHDMKGLLDMSEGSPVPTILGYSNLESLLKLGLTSKDLYKRAKLEIANRVPVIQSVVTGAAHTMMLTKNIKGKVKIYASGLNKQGQLGLGDFDNRNDLTEVLLPDGFMIEELLAGGFHTFIKGKGKNGEDKLYACGSNLNGQLCLLGDNVNRNQWAEVILPTGCKIEQIIVGDHHNFLKGKDVNGEDKLYASGNNCAGQLGLGDNKNRYEWTEVTIPQGFKLDKVVVGAEHSFLQGLGYGYLDKVYASGRNLEGQFGSGDGNSSNEFTEVFMPNGIMLEEVMVGGAHSFLKGKDVGGEDNLYGSGFNRQGQLGLGDDFNRTEWTEVPLLKKFKIEKVMAGKAHTFLKVKDMEGQDKLLISGANIFGLGMDKDRSEFTEVPLPQGFDIEDLIAGHAHGLLKGKDVNGKNKLYAFGNNYSGQLGLGDNENRRDWTGVFLDKNDWLKRILRDERNREAQAKVGRRVPCI